MIDDRDNVAVDEVELRSRLEETVEEAFGLGDELAAAVADRRLPEAARLAANYLQVRALIRQLRRALVAVVAG